MSIGTAIGYYGSSQDLIENARADVPEDDFYDAYSDSDPGYTDSANVFRRHRDPRSERWEAICEVAPTAHSTDVPRTAPMYYGAPALLKRNAALAPHRKVMSASDRLGHASRPISPIINHDVADAPTTVLLVNVAEMGRGFTIAAQIIFLTIAVILTSEISSKSLFVSGYFLLMLLVGGAGLYLTGYLVRREFIAKLEQEAN